MAKRLVAILSCGLLTGCVMLPAIPDWTTIARTQAATDEGGEADLLAPELTLSAEDGFLVPVWINGQPVSLMAELGHAGIVLNADVAARLGLAATGQAQAMVGPIEVAGRFAEADVTTGSAFSRQALVWYDRGGETTADGVINIANLPYQRVTLQLAPPHADDVAITLPTIQTSEHIVHRQQVGDRTIDMRLRLRNARSFATTAAGAQIAQTLGGTWDGPRERHDVAFGIGRDMRPLRLGQSLLIGGSPLLAIDRLLIRMRDYKGRTELPQDPEDEDALVVIGKQSQGANYFVTLGRDLLGRCSSATYVRATAELILRCR